MSASLVGSEMCIRDRFVAWPRAWIQPVPLPTKVCCPRAGASEAEGGPVPVLKSPESIAMPFP
eukprot:4680939-Alexandrium_andersonii.AAC.1